MREGSLDTATPYDGVDEFLGAFRHLSKLADAKAAAQAAHAHGEAEEKPGDKEDK